MKSDRAKKTAKYGMILGLALIVSYVESLLPILIPIPGIKLGLANSILLWLLYEDGMKQATFISVMRVILVSALFGNMAAFFYSFSGALFSILVMTLIKRIGGFSIIGTSIAGGVSHNIGQLFVAAIILQTNALLYYIPVLLVAGALTGTLIGIIAKEIQNRLPKEHTYSNIDKNKF